MSPLCCYNEPEENTGGVQTPDTHRHLTLARRVKKIEGQDRKGEELFKFEDCFYYERASLQFIVYVKFILCKIQKYFIQTLLHI